MKKHKETGKDKYIFIYIYIYIYIYEKQEKETKRNNETNNPTRKMKIILNLSPLFINQNYTKNSRRRSSLFVTKKKTKI